MYNLTNGDSVWQQRVAGFLQASIDTLFPKQYNDQQQLLVEVACEVQGTCNLDQPSFKAYLVSYSSCSPILFGGFVSAQGAVRLGG